MSEILLMHWNDLFSAIIIVKFAFYFCRPVQRGEKKNQRQKLNVTVFFFKKYRFVLWIDEIVSGIILRAGGKSNSSEGPY